MDNPRLLEFEAEIQMLSHIANKGFVLALNIGAMSKPDFLHSTFDKEWRDIYEKKLLYIADPVVIWALRNTGAIRWSQISMIDIRGVFKKAKDYEMNYGAVVALRMNDKPSLLTVCRSDREFTDEEMAIVSDTLDKFTVHQTTNRGLLDGEIKVLKFLSQGYSFKEISEMENISESGAKRRVSNAQVKLGGKNTIQTVSIAKDLGIFGYN